MTTWDPATLRIAAMLLVATILSACQDAPAAPLWLFPEHAGGQLALAISLFRRF